MPTRSTADNAPVITVCGVSKSYGPAETRVLALHQVDLVVKRGEFVCLIGASGSGKSTRLNLIGGLDRPCAGTIELADRSPSGLFFSWLDRRVRRRWGLVEDEAQA